MNYLLSQGTRVRNLLYVIGNKEFLGFPRIRAKMTAVDQNSNLLLHAKQLRLKELVSLSLYSSRLRVYRIELDGQNAA